MVTASLIFTILGLLMAFLPKIRKRWWWIRIFDFPKIQIACWLLAGVIIQVFTGATDTVGVILIIAALATVVYLTHNILEFLPWSKEDAKSTTLSEEERKNKSISILISNVLMTNNDHDSLRKLILKEKPDVILLAEVNEAWLKDLEPIEEHYPHVYKTPQADYYGMAFYCRYPLKETTWRYLVENTVPSIYTQIQLPNGEWVEFYGLHPQPPHPNHDAVERDFELVMVANEIKQKNTPTIVAGDMNDVCWSKTTQKFERISKLLDPRKGRGLYNSFNAKFFFLRWPLDHMFHSDHFTIARMERMPYIGSDHFPMLIILVKER